MKVLVTGGCGFIGSHVCEFYISNGAEVISYDNMTKYELSRTGYAADEARDYNWNLLEKMGVIMVKADIRDAKTLLETTEGCNYIVHTAAQPAMTISWEDPELDFSTNARGSFNVLETARKLKIPVVSCATIHVYGPGINESLTEGETRYLRQPPGIDENLPILQGIITPLHASKRAAELYVQTYIDTYNVEAASFRLTGLYGPRQFGGEDHGWVANFAIRTVLDKSLSVFGTGKQIRDILYATDVVKAFHAFYENRKPGIYNIGGEMNNAISLLECIIMLGEIIGKKPEVKFESERHGDLYYFVSDCSKAKRELGWEATVPPREGITKLVDWIKENIEIFRVS